MEGLTFYCIRCVKRNKNKEVSGEGRCTLVAQNKLQETKIPAFYLKYDILRTLVSHTKIIIDI